MYRFRNRTEAGRELATMLHAFAGRPDVLVLGLPRGGVPVAFEVAEALHAPLDAFTVRNLGAPDDRSALPSIKDRTVIVVDDGLATGATMHAAVVALRTLQPARVVVATPIASREAAEAVRSVADDFLCACLPVELLSVGQWYEDFSQTTDEDVLALLRRAPRPSETPRRADAAGAYYA